ncbi:MAG: hypothetical protein ACRD22_08885 [Terriglobia bacterium]
MMEAVAKQAMKIFEQIKKRIKEENLRLDSDGTDPAAAVWRALPSEPGEIDTEMIHFSQTILVMARIQTSAEAFLFGICIGKALEQADRKRLTKTAGR